MIVFHRGFVLFDVIQVILLRFLLFDPSAVATASPVSFAKRCSLHPDVLSFVFNQSSKSYLPTTSLNKTDGILSRPSLNKDKNYTENAFYKMRECPCAPPGTTAYCMQNVSNHCEISADGGVMCYYESSSSGFLKNTFTITVLWYAALLIFFLTTDNGKHSRDYMLSFICPSRNRRIVQSLVDQELQIRDRMQRFSQQQRRESLEVRPYTPNENHELVLKTRVYHSSHSPRTPNTIASNDSFDFDSDENSDLRCSRLSNAECNKDETLSANDEKNLRAGSPCESQGIALMSHDETGDCCFGNNDDDIEGDEISCSICLAPVEDGERVGALTCNHIFHSGCLKDWLRRHNRCPLCQTPVAEVRQCRRPSNESQIPPSLERPAMRVSGAVEWNGNPVVTAYRIQQPSGSVRILYRLERPAASRLLTPRLFSAFGSNSESSPTNGPRNNLQRNEGDANVRDEETGNF